MIPHSQQLDVDIVELREPGQHLDASMLLGRLWRVGANGIVTPSLLTALAHAGGYVGGAYVEGTLVGAAVGLRGRDHLHSHVAGVDPDVRRANIGYLLKTHQRQWTAKEGLAEIRWTFDPLIERNAAFNLHKLGAAISGYQEEFYGVLDDGINVGDATDRLWVRWSVDEPTPPKRVTLDQLADAHILLDHALQHHPAADAPALAVAVPEDIEAMRAIHPKMAMLWRLAVRDALQEALNAGYVIRGITHDRYYTLGLP